MKKFTALLILALVSNIFAPAASVFAQSGANGTINVYAQKTNGDKVSNISFTVTLEASEFAQTKSTDVTGKAAFTGLGTGTYTIKINLTSTTPYLLADGESTTKQVTLTGNDTEEVYFGVKPKPTDEGGEDEEVEISIPDVFYEAGSTTTKVDGFDKDDLKALNNFTLHIPGFAKIVFTRPVNLSSDDAIARLAKLDQYVFLDAPGEVTVASDMMPELDKPATVTLYGLSVVSVGPDYKPFITIDDLEPKGTEVENVVLTGDDTISFQVSGFSTYAFRPTIFFEETQITTTESNYTLKGMIDDLESEVSVFLNDERVNVNPVIKDDGSFEVDLELTEKDNLVQVTAVGISEQNIAEVVNITYEGGEERTEEGSDMTMVLIGLAILGLVGLGGLYYAYKKGKLDKFFKQKAKTAPVSTGNNFDSRLMTAEERSMYNSPSSNNEAK